MCLICDGVSAETRVQITVSALQNASVCKCSSEVTTFPPGQILNSGNEILQGYKSTMSERQDAVEMNYMQEQSPIDEKRAPKFHICIFYRVVKSI